MSYRLDNQERLPDGIRRIATEQIDRALGQLTTDVEDRDEAIHDARKCFKKVRAVLRLVRDEIGDDVYRSENVCFRDAGKQLSDIRDSAVMVQTLDKLTENFSDELKNGTMKEIRQELANMHEQAKQTILDKHDTTAEVANTIRKAKERVADWPIQGDDFSALADGLKRVYKRGRNRMQDAYESQTTEDFHDWRKRVKYLWYHMRILRPIWPNVLREVADSLHDLSDHLGDDHDLAELRRVVFEDRTFSNDGKLQPLNKVINQRRVELRVATQPIAERIYVEKPGAFVERIGAYWQAWR